MDKNTARQLVEKIFQSPFDKDSFVYFVKNLLNYIDESKAFHVRGYVKEKFRKVTPIIKTYERIGTYTDPEENKIDILIVYLQKDNSLDRARSTLRNFVADYLKQRDEKDAALVAFVSPNKNDWRFSLVKMEYKLAKTQTGRVRAKEELTPARRYSFLVGIHESSHTAQSRFVPILEDDVSNPTLKQLEESFNIERVNKEFFENYRNLFLWAKEELDKIFRTNQKVKSEFKEKNIDLVVFTKKLLGQIVFLYFLQKKGWLGAKEKFGDGDRKFLKNLLEKAKKENKNFFNDYLEFLFYDALNNERRGSADPSYYLYFGCKIPFLNGGLFEPLGNYDWKNTDITLPNELFSNDFRTKQGDIGTGILDIFDRFNFTVKEDEPLDREVAVDPELLGKLYEKFNAITSDNFSEYLQIIKNGKKGEEAKFNKQYGVYYTPTEIVQYMCKESLINYLTSKFEGKIDKSDFEKLTNDASQILENEKISLIKKEKIESGEQKNTKYKFKTPLSIKCFAKEIDDALANIKICDPAVGSGAFPIGMMSQIVTIRELLSALLKTNKNRYDLKLECIENSLYGVDIDPGAIEICRLRFWLSLVVDEERLDITPLPNLDYKVMQGNSLLEEYEGIKLFDKSLLYAQLPDEAEIENLKQHKSKIEKQLLEFYQQNPRWMNNKKIEKPENLLALEKERERIILILKDKEKFKIQDFEITNLFGEEKESKKIWEKLKELQHKYFSTFDESKFSIREEIENLIWKLIEETLIENGQKSKISEIQKIKKSGKKPFFIWELNFPEIFANNDKLGGFDVVIANPPYIRQEKIKDQKPFLQKYEVYNSTSDLYTYFYEKSYQILKQEGFSCFISSNKWMRAKYGEKLRRFFKEKTTLKQIIDFNGYQVFDATVDTNILLFQKTKPSENIVHILNIQPDFTPSTDITNYFNSHKLEMRQSELDINCFTFADETVINLKAKIERIGKPLKDWDVKIYYGIKTGLNEAFIIDTETKEKLCKEDPKSAEIIKPILRGRDIYRYGYKWAGLWVIIVKFGFWKELNNYPAIKKHLMRYERQLKNRGQCRYSRGEKVNINTEYTGQHHWLELDNNPKDNYLSEFEKAKIVWQEIVREPSFAYDAKNFYCEATTFLMTGKNLKYLIAILNSKPATFFFKQFYAGGGLGESGYRYKKVFLERLPVPKIAESDQKPFIDLVDKILAITKDNDYLENSSKQAKVHDYEKQIDQIVYKLYGLTEEEIKIVEQ